MTKRITPPEALIYCMFTASTVDRTVSTAELDRIGSIVRELPAFKGYSRDWFADEAQACGRVLGKPGGVEAVLDLVTEALAPELRETAYVLASEVVETDQTFRSEERHFLEMLAAKLNLDRLVVAALERAVRARHRNVSHQ
jgi:uncharacterized membrane protein YebE (DUF533 family)